MADFVIFLRFFGNRIFVIFKDIALKIVENMLLGSRFRINLVPLKNIDIWPSYGPKRPIIPAGVLLGYHVSQNCVSKISDPGPPPKAPENQKWQIRPKQEFIMTN